MSNYIIINNELYHHGVKGQKWGVRRYQNPDGSLTPAGKRRANKDLRKEIRTTKDKVRAEEYDRLYKKYGVREKWEATYAYGRKHGLDLDDGGGGSDEAGEKYWKLTEEADAAETRAGEESMKYARDFVYKKYGEKAVKDVERRDTAKALAVITPVLALPVATVIGLIATDSNIRN